MTKGNGNCESHLLVENSNTAKTEITLLYKNKLHAQKMGTLRSSSTDSVFMVIVALDREKPATAEPPPTSRVTPLRFEILPLLYICFAAVIFSCFHPPIQNKIIKSKKFITNDDDVQGMFFRRWSVKKCSFQNYIISMQEIAASLLLCCFSCTSQKTRPFSSSTRTGIFFFQEGNNTLCSSKRSRR